MKVLYTAPNRGHHYKYAAALNKAGFLHAFVSGFPRISPRSSASELNGKLHRSDIIQTLYVFSLKSNMHYNVSNMLAYISKIEQDYACRRFVKDCDVFLFYSGSGLSSSRYGKKKGIINIVEAVNCHVDYQEAIIKNEHDSLSLPWRPFFEREKIRRLKEYEEADYILLPSDFVKRSFLKKGFKEEKLLKVAYGFNKSETQSRSQRVRNEQFTILYVGTISVRKGVRYLIKAFQKLHHPNKKLFIVGPDANDGALNGIVLTSDITFCGVLKDKKLEDAYSSADVFCLPSIEEGLALVLGEALSYGLPIIATDNTGAEEIITNGKEGFIVPIQSPDIIYEKLQLLVDNPGILESLRHASIEKSSKLHGWAEAGLLLTNVLLDVFKRG